jgi:hypothetical protein
MAMWCQASFTHTKLVSSSFVFPMTGYSIHALFDINFDAHTHTHTGCGHIETNDALDSHKFDCCVRRRAYVSKLKLTGDCSKASHAHTRRIMNTARLTS